jgi:hypothetical protein
MSLEADKRDTILKDNDTFHSDSDILKKDCLLCRLTGSLGLLGISAYVFFNATKQPRRTNKVFLNFLGSGKISTSFLLYSRSFQVVSNYIIRLCSLKFRQQSLYIFFKLLHLE